MTMPTVPPDPTPTLDAWVVGYEDDRAYFTAEEPQRYVLGDPAAPLLALNDVDSAGVMWVCEEPGGWDAPVIDLPIDRKQGGHGGIPGEPTYVERVLTFTGSAEAPTPALARAARKRLMRAILDAVRTGEEVEFWHLDDEPAKCLYVLPTADPRCSISSGRWLDYSFTLVAGDPIKRGATVVYGPVRLPSTTTEPGRLYVAGNRFYTAGNRTYGQTAAIAETRRNRVTNPRGVQPAGAAHAWTAQVVGGAASGTYLTGQAAPFAGGPTTAFRSTVTTASAPGILRAIVGTASPATLAEDGIPVTPGEQYVASLYGRPSVATNTRAELVWYSAAGAYLSEGAGSPTAHAANAWARRQATGVAPANAAYARAIMRQDTSALGNTLDATAAQWEQGAAATAYLDGEGADTASLVQAWTGAANASPSVEQTVTVSDAATLAATTVAFVRNDGDEPAPALLTINGPVPGPLVQFATGEFIELNLDLTANDVAVIDTGAGTIYVNGVNRFDALAYRSTFPMIPPGGTEVRLRSVIGGSHHAAGLLIETAPRWT